MCGPCVVVCGDFEIFQSSPVCGPCVVVCGDFENFQSSPVCGLCTFVCRDFEIISKYSVCALYCGVWRLVFHEKIPIGIFSLYWRDWFFRVKIPVLERSKAVKKTKR